MDANDRFLQALATIQKECRRRPSCEDCPACGRDACRLAGSNFLPENWRLKDWKPGSKKI